MRFPRRPKRCCSTAARCRVDSASDEPRPFSSWLEAYCQRCSSGAVSGCPAKLSKSGSVARLPRQAASCRKWRVAEPAGKDRFIDVVMAPGRPLRLFLMVGESISMARRETRFVESSPRFCTRCRTEASRTRGGKLWANSWISGLLTLSSPGSEHGLSPVMRSMSDVTSNRFSGVFHWRSSALSMFNTYSIGS